MLQGIYLKIDDRKRAEQALRTSEERWQTVFETSSVGIATSDENLRIATANVAFQRMVATARANHGRAEDETELAKVSGTELSDGG
jgi:PAS domain-containing protein